MFPLFRTIRCLPSYRCAERLAQHRADAACASCHNLIDPVGFSLENFDAVGRWRNVENDRPVDASGGLPDGRRFDGVEGLEIGLRELSDVFVGTLSEKLLTYALGRGIESEDGPAIREMTRTAQEVGLSLLGIDSGNRQ